MTSETFLQQAKDLQARILRGESNETPVQAWAAVCRACAKASNAKRNELKEVSRYGYTRLELNWFNNLERIWWPARAQVETIVRGLP